MKTTRVGMLVLLMGALSACGGGGSGGADSSSPEFIGFGSTNTKGGLAVNLAWQPNPGDINGYKVYYGTAPNTANQQISDLPLTTQGFDPLAPSVAYDASNLSGVSQVCFRVKAYKQRETSDFSEAVCGDIPL